MKLLVFTLVRVSVKSKTSRETRSLCFKVFPVKLWSDGFWSPLKKQMLSLSKRPPYKRFYQIPGWLGFDPFGFSQKSGGLTQVARFQCALNDLPHCRSRLSRARGRKKEKLTLTEGAFALFFQRAPSAEKQLQAEEFGVFGVLLGNHRF